MIGRRLENYNYILESEGNTVRFYLGAEVIVRIKGEKRIIKGVISGVGGKDENIITELVVRKPLQNNSKHIPLSSIESLEVCK